MMLVAAFLSLAAFLAFTFFAGAFVAVVVEVVSVWVCADADGIKNDAESSDNEMAKTAFLVRLVM